MADDDGREAFARRLTELMASEAQDDGHPWTVPAVARALTERGHPISRQHLSGLKQRKHAPTWDLVRALAHLFGTTTDSFTGAKPTSGQELPALLARGELDEDDLGQVAEFVRFLHQRRRPSE